MISSSGTCQLDRPKPWTPGRQHIELQRRRAGTGGEVHHLAAGKGATAATDLQRRPTIDRVEPGAAEAAVDDEPAAVGGKGAGVAQAGRERAEAVEGAGDLQRAGGGQDAATHLERPAG